MKQAFPFKHLLLLSILLASSLPAFSQHFDWVKTYTGEEVTSGGTTNQLIGSCVDSAGNLYILGEFSPQAQLCGTNLLPFEFIETSRPPAAYLLTVTTADGRELTFRLVKQYGRR